jgi:F420H(2)-dependent quinone reductase
LIVIASNAGHNHHPGWYYNLRANPIAKVYWRGWVRPFRAREARGEERAALWRMASNYYAGFAQYEQRTTREIPVMILDPLGDTATGAPRSGSR